MSVTESVEGRETARDLLDAGMAKLLKNMGVPESAAVEELQTELGAAWLSDYEKIRDEILAGFGVSLTVYLGTPKSEENPLEAAWRRSVSEAK